MITKSFEEISVGDIAVTDPRVVTEDYVRSFGRTSPGTAILFTSTPTTRSRRASVARSPTVLSCCPPCSVWWSWTPVTCSASTGSIRSDSTGPTLPRRLGACGVGSAVGAPLARTVRPRS